MENRTFTRKELYDLVWQNPMLSLAKKYRISDVGLRKVCVRMEIPVPPAGYWQKLKFGKKVKRVPLPSKYSGDKDYTIQIRQDGDEFLHGIPSSSSIKQKEIEGFLKEALSVPEKLTKPDKLILEAREYLKNKKPDNWLYKNMVETKRGLLEIRVSPDNVDRALRFMDTLIKALRIRGHSIEIDHKTHIIVNKQKLEVCLKERLKKVVVPDTYRKNTEYHPTGLLYFKMDGYYGKEWIDGKLTLEEQLSRILAKLELTAEKWSIEQEEYRRKEEERKAKELIENEKWERKKKELIAFKKLLAESERWQRVKLIRSYINDIESLKKNEDNGLGEIEEWLVWAKNKVDWYDPYVNLEDPLLEDVDKETLSFR
jgi:hypothetical protein